MMRSKKSATQIRSVETSFRCPRGLKSFQNRSFGSEYIEMVKYQFTRLEMKGVSVTVVYIYIYIHTHSNFSSRQI